MELSCNVWWWNYNCVWCFLRVNFCTEATLIIPCLINSVLKNEAIRNEQMICEYEKLISELPKGSLICRKKEYYYLKYRKDGKVCDEYIGKDPEIVETIKEQIERRKHYEKMLSVLKREQKTITKMMEGLQ